MLKGQRVINTLLIIIVSFIYSCKNEGIIQRDAEFLDFYIKEYRNLNKADSIFLGYDNNNKHILETLERYLSSDMSLDDLDYPLNEIILKSEYENFKNQLVIEGDWEIDQNVLEKVYFNKNEKLSHVLFVTKPIYSNNGKFAMAFSHKKDSINIHFIPSIEVFEYKNKSWRKVSKIKHIGF